MLLTSQGESGVLNLSLGVILTYKSKNKKKKTGLTGKMDMIIDITYLRKNLRKLKLSITQRVRETLDYSTINWMYPPNPPPHKLRESHGRGGEECEIPSWRSLRKQGPLNQQEQSSDELTETEAASTEPARVSQVLWAYIMALVFLWNY